MSLKVNLSFRAYLMLQTAVQLKSVFSTPKLQLNGAFRSSCTFNKHYTCVLVPAANVEMAI